MSLALATLAALALHVDDVRELDRLDRSGALARIEDLRLTCDGCLARLARARHARAIRTLRLEGCATDEYLPYQHVECIWIDERGARALARSRALPKLVELHVTARGGVMAALLAGPLVAKVRTLDVVTDSDGVRDVAAARRLRALTDLRIFSPGMSAAAVQELVSSRHLRALVSLRFVSSDSEAEHTIGAEGILALAAWLDLPALRTLDVSWSPVGDDAIRVLARAPWLDQLDTLDVVHTGAHDRTLAALRARVPAVIDDPDAP